MKFSVIIKFAILILFFIALIAPFTFLKPEKKEKIVEVEEKKPVIVPEKPLHSVKLPDFSSILDIPTKKKSFFGFIKPTVIEENQKIADDRRRVLFLLEKLSLDETLLDVESEWLSAIAKKYRVSEKYSQFHQLNELVKRVDIIPTELVLVQAANESAWGTSRFARIGLNYFGIWCYKKGCGMVPKGRNVGAKHEVAAFQSVQEAVEAYLININRNSAYSTFRLIRHQLRQNDQELSPEILATGLLPYSERGTDYVLELTQMIRHNERYF